MCCSPLSSALPLPSALRMLFLIREFLLTELGPSLGCYGEGLYERARRLRPRTSNLPATHYPLLGGQPLAGHGRLGGTDWHVLLDHAEHPHGCPARPQRYPGDYLHEVGPEPRYRRGPGHVSHCHCAARCPESEGSASPFRLRLLLCLLLPRSAER